MKFQSIPTIIEAEQFLPGRPLRSPLPNRVHRRADGSCYVITIHGGEASIEPGDWIVHEPVSDVSAYPCKPEIFETRYRPIRTCRVCGCTDADCRQCIERTGEQCYWVEADLCSACVEGEG